MQRNFGKIYDVHPVPDLTEIQTRSYERFLQADLPAEERDDAGLEGVFREIFPIESYDKTLKLEYIKFDLGKPRYEPDECRQLRLTYGRPFRVWLRLNKQPEPIEEEVYLGDMPIMIGGGEFIINGAERVVVSQLHRSPGVDFVVETSRPATASMHSCRIIPERGSWIEVHVTKKDTLGVRIDQSGKFSSMTLLRAMRPGCSPIRRDILRAFYPTEDGRSRSRTPAPLARQDRIAVGDVIDPKTGEVYIDSRIADHRGLAIERADDAGQAGQHPGHDQGRHHPQVAGRRTRRPTHEAALAEDLHSGSVRATRRSWRRRSSSSTRSSRTPTATAWVRSADSASTGSSTRPSPRTEMTLRPARLPQRHPLHPQAAQGRGAASTTSTTWATAACGPSTSWPPTSCARASSSSAAPSRSG